jgi:hypothetical protein
LPSRGRPGGGGQLTHSRPERISNIQASRDGRRELAQEVRGQFRDSHYDHRHWFGDQWWQEHPHAHWRFHQGTNWWRRATWGGVAAWVPWGWSEPSYYYYGENIYYQDDSVYYGDQVVATAEEYAGQAEELATSVPKLDAEKVEWLPLGVYAVTSQQGGEPTMFLQLALSKEGIIAGTLQNTANNTVKSVEGMVDRKTQRAAWAVVDTKRPIMETGLNNLTEDQSPALVHFADGQTQQWLLVRLEEPNTTSKK